MLDLDAVPWETRKCCAKDMRKAAQIIAIAHMVFFGPVLFGMLYILNNQKSTLFFGDHITGPLPSELQPVLVASLVVLGLRLVFSFVLFVAEKSRSVVLLRVWLAAHLLLSLAECGLITALSTVVFVVDPDVWPFVGTLLGGFALLGLQTYMLHVVLCLHTGLMKEWLLRRQVAQLHSQLNQLAVSTGYTHPLTYATLSLSPQILRPPGKAGLNNGVTTPPVGNTAQSPPVGDTGETQPAAEVLRPLGKVDLDSGVTTPPPADTRQSPPVGDTGQSPPDSPSATLPV
ncbi:uncharacterized protein LOC126210579 [Schistocerca nitens]|uniref:uncharacterized protein LOC126210579 n=1 Tax=Schistocerca nitens TaxID=7011 RepID=UPI002117A657|nr:uncharacterized protein LOC126210579 [Schistocerca nitens]